MIFQEKFKILFSVKFIFRDLNLIFFYKFRQFLLLKGRQIPLSDSKSVELTKNVMDF